MRWHDQKGLTLLEVIISVALIAVAFGTIHIALQGAIRIWEFSSNRIDLQQNARIAISMMDTDIKRSNQVLPTSSSDSLILLIDGRENKYYLKGRQILKSVDEQGNNPVAYNVNALKFAYYPSVDDCSLIKIDIELTYGDYSYPISTQVHIRSYHE
ncbi:MAG: type II secretion system protein [Bacillota bacterium]